MAGRIFRRFKFIKEKASDGNPYALRVYMQFLDLFEKDIDIINDFISQKNIDVVKFLERGSAKEKGSAKIFPVKIESVKGVEPIDGNPKKVEPTLKTMSDSETVKENSADSKYDEHKKDVIKKFIAYANELPCKLKIRWRGLCNSNADLKKFAFSESKDDKPKEMASESDFLKNRYYNQQKYFSKKAGECKDKYHENQEMIMLISVVISVISVLSTCVCNFFDKDCSIYIANVFSVVVAILSAMTAYISSNDKLYQNLSFWIRYRVASEKLKSEYALYQGRCGVYNILREKTDKDGHSLAEKKFRENVEGIVQEANDNFTSLLQSDNGSLIKGVDMEKIVAVAANKVAERTLKGKDEKADKNDDEKDEKTDEKKDEKK